MRCFPSRITLVDVGASRVLCATFRRGRNGALTLERFARAERTFTASDDGWSEDAAPALAAAADAGGEVGPAETHLVVPGYLTLTKFVKIPAIAGRRRTKVIRFEASQAIPPPLSATTWDHAIAADDGRELDVMFSAAKTEAVEALCAAAATAGLAIARTTPVSTALRRGFAFNHPEASEPRLLVNIGARSTQLLFLAADRFFGRTLALGGDTVTRLVAGQLRNGFAQAERIKRLAAAGRDDPVLEPAARAAVAGAAETFTAKLQLELARTIAGVERRCGASLRPARIYLAGGGAWLPALSDALAARFDLPVERYDPLRRVEVAPAAAAAGATRFAPTLGKLVGLAAGLPPRDRERIPNLLPAARGAARAFHQRRPWWLAAAALAALAPWPAIRHYQTAAANARARTAAIDAQLAPLRRAAAEQADRRAQAEALTRQIAALRTLRDARANWVGLFADLQHRLGEVEDAWLERWSTERAGTEGNENPAVRITLGGCLLDRDDPALPESAGARRRVLRLLGSFAQSPFVAAVENERFDSSRPGLLRFDVTLVMQPEKPL